VIAVLDIPLAMPENEIRLVTAKLSPSPKADFDAHDQGPSSTLFDNKNDTPSVARPRIQPKTASTAAKSLFLNILKLSTYF
jgi:hypothetical protein